MWFFKRKSVRCHNCGGRMYAIKKPSKESDDVDALVSFAMKESHPQLEDLTPVRCERCGYDKYMAHAHEFERQ